MVKIEQVQIDNIITAINNRAKLASPALTGTPTAPTAATGTNTTQIANTSFVNTNFVPFIGGIITGSLTVNGTLSAGSIVETSSKRFKENVQNITNPLETVKQLQGVTYNWIESGKGDIGFIAEEMEKVIPVLVEKSEDGVVQGMNYGKLTALLVEVVKAQQVQIDELKGRIDGIIG
jgi:hypothetical protein